MNKAGAPGLTILALSLALPVAAASQQAAADGPDGTRAAALAEADALRKEAAELYTTDASNWDRLIRLHLQAAKTAPPDDPARVEDLWMAGVASRAVGKLRAAQRHIEAAGDLASELNDYYRAGDCYLAAAILAAERGNLSHAKHLIDQAENMADPELLDPELCDCLKQRIAMLRGKSS
jgi:hypothetical protein